MFHVEHFYYMANNLGKGLGALISMFDEDMEELTNKDAGKNVPRGETNRNVPRGTFSEQPANTDTQEIPLNLIDNNLSQPRKSFNAEEMRELEQSITTHGVLQPILLNKVGSRYMIVAGERRFRACKTLGLKTIPAIVRTYSQKQIAEISLVENLMRSDLNEIEIAIGIKKLMDTYLMTQEQVSVVLGKSRSAIANNLRILNLPQEVQTMLEQKQISLGHAKCLVSVTDKNHCVSLARRCADGSMTVRELELAIVPRAEGAQGSARSAGSYSGTISLDMPKIQSLELKEFILTLTQAFATKVSIQGNDHKGKIIIEYNTQKDLERIKSRIK